MSGRRNFLKIGHSRFWGVEDRFWHLLLTVEGVAVVEVTLPQILFADFVGHEKVEVLVVTFTARRHCARECSPSLAVWLAWCCLQVHECHLVLLFSRNTSSFHHATLNYASWYNMKTWNKRERGFYPLPSTLHHFCFQVRGLLISSSPFQCFAAVQVTNTLNAELMFKWGPLHRSQLTKYSEILIFLTTLLMIHRNWTWRVLKYRL